MDEGLKMILEGMRQDIHAVKLDVRTILEAKWRAEGKRTTWTIIVGAIITLVFQTTLALIQRGG